MLIVNFFIVPMFITFIITYIIIDKKIENLRNRRKKLYDFYKDYYKIDKNPEIVDLVDPELIQ